MNSATDFVNTAQIAPWTIQRLASFELPAIDPVSATAGLTSFNSKFVIGAWRHRYKESLELLRLGGLCGDGALSVVDPYTSVPRTMDWSNIWEHNLAVGFAASVLSEWLLSAKLITPEEREAIIVHAQTHDATKTFEVFRTQFFNNVQFGARALEESMRSSASLSLAFARALEAIYSQDQIPEAVPHYARALAWICLRRNLIEASGIIRLEPTATIKFPSVELDLELIANDPLYRFLESTPDSYEAHLTLELALQRSAYSNRDKGLLLESCGYGCSPRSMRELFTLEPDGRIGVRGNWIQRVVMLADNLTATPVSVEARSKQTFFVTCRERQVVTDLHGRYPTVGTRGIGLIAGVRVDDADLQLSPPGGSIAAFGKVQWFISEQISSELARIHSQSDRKDAGQYVKEQVNMALQVLI